MGPDPSVQILKFFFFLEEHALRPSKIVCYFVLEVFQYSANTWKALHVILGKQKVNR